MDLNIVWPLLIAVVCVSGAGDGKFCRLPPPQAIKKHVTGLQAALYLRHRQVVRSVKSIKHFEVGVCDCAVGINMALERRGKSLRAVN